MRNTVTVLIPATFARQLAETRMLALCRMLVSQSKTRDGGQDRPSNHDARVAGAENVGTPCRCLHLAQGQHAASKESPPSKLTLIIIVEAIFEIKLLTASNVLSAPRSKNSVTKKGQSFRIPAP